MPKRKATILVAEDDPDLRELYSITLETEGFSVIKAKDGEEALSFAKAHRPDLVLLDIMMPKLDGLSVLSEIKGNADTKDIKVAIVSALQNEKNQKKAKDQGAEAYLIKSQAGFSEIVSTVTKILEVKDGQK